MCVCVYVCMSFSPAHSLTPPTTTTPTTDRYERSADVVHTTASWPPNKREEEEIIRLEEGRNTTVAPVLVPAGQRSSTLASQDAYRSALAALASGGSNAQGRTQGPVYSQQQQEKGEGIVNEKDE